MGVARRLLVVCTGLCLLAGSAAWTVPPPAPASPDPEPLRQQRRHFQAQELIPAKPFSFIFNAGDPPRIVWRDLEEVRRLGCDQPLRVRWFDADLREAPAPDRPGRWGAYIQSTAPNGLPLVRAMTFYCRPPEFFLYWPEQLRLELPHETAPVDAQVWAEHEREIAGVGRDLLLRALNDSEGGAILLAGLAEAQPLGRPARASESAAVRNDDFHLRLKLKAQGLESQVRPLAPPMQRRGAPAPVLRAAPPAEAGAREDAKRGIDAVCRAWADATGEPFVTLVARHGVVITHEPFGTDKAGRPIDRGYRGDMASITKTLTAMLFSRFIDQQRIGLDDPVSTVFPHYPQDDPRVPTFRQCLTHTSGITGHGDWGGVRNPHFENVVLNAIDLNRPGARYDYSSNAYELVGKAMEIVAGKCALRLFAEDLFAPLGLEDVPMSGAGSGAQLTAAELAVLAQWLANGGSYGQLQFIRPQTFEQMLPEPLDRRYPGIPETEGLGMHWMHPTRPGAAPGSTRPQDLFLSPRTIGHGSLSSTIFLIDLERDLIIIQVRRQAGADFASWSAKFYQAVLDGLVDEPPATAPATAPATGAAQ